MHMHAYAYISFTVVCSDVLSLDDLCAKNKMIIDSVESLLFELQLAKKVIIEKAQGSTEVHIHSTTLVVNGDYASCAAQRSGYGAAPAALPTPEQQLKFNSDQAVITFEDGDTTVALVKPAGQQTVFVTSGQLIFEGENVLDCPPASPSGGGK